jgi:hypothetical protein
MCLAYRQLLQRASAQGLPSQTCQLFAVAQVEDLGEKCPQSARGYPLLLWYLAVVMVQDGCALLSSSDPETLAAANANPVHRLLLKHKVFRCERVSTCVDTAELGWRAQ